MKVNSKRKPLINKEETYKAQLKTPDRKKKRKERKTNEKERIVKQEHTRNPVFLSEMLEKKESGAKHIMKPDLENNEARYDSDLIESCYTKQVKIKKVNYTD